MWVLLDSNVWVKVQEGNCSTLRRIQSVDYWWSVTGRRTSAPARRSRKSFFHALFNRVILISVERYFEGHNDWFRPVSGFHLLREEVTCRQRQAGRWLLRETDAPCPRYAHLHITKHYSFSNVITAWSFSNTSFIIKWWLLQSNTTGK